MALSLLREQMAVLWKWRVSSHNTTMTQWGGGVTGRTMTKLGNIIMAEGGAFPVSVKGISQN